MAKEHPLPSNAIYSVEFPGVVGNGSIFRAIEHLGGQKAIERAFGRNVPKSDAFLELNWRPGCPFAHPIPGHVVHSAGIVLKITKRKRKRNDASLSEIVGDFKAEAVGCISKTVRFRSMADFQYQPDSSDPVVTLRQAMDQMDVDFLRKYAIPPEKEDYAKPATSQERLDLAHKDEKAASPIQSNLRLMPPPMFSRQSIPQVYNYRANNMSVIETIVDSKTGLEKKRFINKARWKGYGPASISFSDKIVPHEPPKNVREMQDQADARILASLRQIFVERPIWTRVALNNQFSAGDVREITNSKYLISMVCYVFVDGPWRDTLLRFGYDPRRDPSARFYQRLYFRNLNHPIVRPSIVGRRQEHRGPEKQATTVPSQPQSLPSTGEEPASHIFDGIHLTKETAAYQLCDITDPLLKGMIEDEAAVRDECNEREGWYTTYALERIKMVLRHKFFSLQEGRAPRDEECLALLNSEAGTRPITTHTPRWQARKHNLAKGALPPEDAAAARLRAALEKGSSMYGKSMQPQ